MDIEPLLIRTRAGDQRAYAEVVAVYQHMVYTVCHRVLRNGDDAEEATQDTFVKAYRNLDGFTGRSKFSTWLFSIAYRTAVSHGRKRRSDGPSIDDLAEHPAVERETSMHVVDVRWHLSKALGTLKAEDASILSFHYLEELSVEEIVTVTGLSASNVKVKLHRGRRRLLDVLNHALGGKARTLLLDHA